MVIEFKSELIKIRRDLSTGIIQKLNESLFLTTLVLPSYAQPFAQTLPLPHAEVHQLSEHNVVL